MKTQNKWTDEETEQLENCLKRNNWVVSHAVNELNTQMPTALQVHSRGSALQKGYELRNARKPKRKSRVVAIRNTRATEPAKAPAEHSNGTAPTTVNQVMDRLDQITVAELLTAHKVMRILGVITSDNDTNAVNAAVKLIMKGDAQD